MVIENEKFKIPEKAVSSKFDKAFLWRTKSGTKSNWKEEKPSHFGYTSSNQYKRRNFELNYKCLPLHCPILFDYIRLMLDVKKNGLEFGRNYNLPSACSTSTHQSTQNFQNHHHRGFPRRNLDGLPDNSCFMITSIIRLCSLHFFRERMIYSSTHFHGTWNNLHIASILHFLNSTI